jgi:anti-sigma28 factor (negative regulator of flagellin synthesis)
MNNVDVMKAKKYTLIKSPSREDSSKDIHIKEIRDAIESGSYKVNVKALARKILKSLPI